MTADRRESCVTAPEAPDPIPEAAVVLLSGGIDSVTLLHYLRRRLGIRRLYALSFAYGQRHERELECARWQARAAEVVEHRVLDLPAFGAMVAGGTTLTQTSGPVPDQAALPPSALDQPPTYVPNRNMVLLSLAAAYGEAQGAPAVFYGAQTQDTYGYWDCTPDFVARMNAVLALNRRTPVRLYAPFIRCRKVDELRLGLELGVDYARTWTCYRGESRPCGTCPACVERATAFREHGLRDPLS